MSTYNIQWQSTRDGAPAEAVTIPGKGNISLPQNTLNNNTDLTLTGRGVVNYGEIQQENFIRLLENFASSNAPTNPTVGQLWFDTLENLLKVYDVTQSWETITPGVNGGPQPSNPVSGELWWDSVNGLLYVYDGANWVLLGGTGFGPSYTSATAPVNPETGDLWWNTTDNSLYAYNGTDWVLVGGDSYSPVYLGATAPANPISGDLWWDTGASVLNIYNGTSWVLASGNSSSGTAYTGSNAPANPNQGDLWWDTDNNTLSVYVGSSWILVTSSNSNSSGVNAGSSPPANPALGDLWWDTVNNVLNVYDGTAWVPAISSSIGYPSIVIVTGTTHNAAVNEECVITNGTAATTITLPASPASGDIIWITNATDRTDNVIARNGNMIQGLAENLIINTEQSSFELRYINAAIGWRIKK